MNQRYSKIMAFRVALRFSLFTFFLSRHRISSFDDVTEEMRACGNAYRTNEIRLKSESAKKAGRQTGPPRIVNNNYELTCRAKAASGD